MISEMMLFSPLVLFIGAGGMLLSYLRLETALSHNRVLDAGMCGRPALLEVYFLQYVEDVFRTQKEC
jgi:hypothetical protein